MRIKVMKSEKAQRDWHGVMEEVTDGTDIVVERYNKPLFAIISLESYLAFLQHTAQEENSDQAAIVRDTLHSGKLTATVWRDLKAQLSDES